MTRALAIQPIEGATLGAVVTGVNLRSLGGAAFEKIEDAWHKHGVLIFREQFLSPEDKNGPLVMRD